ncbi:TPA: hypothetical protein MJC07_28085 [Klebsiella pneumoniae]|uniref:hypothetical protein n=1 Tax=Klebsiella/Raoultella group TaxID=2890311 RepID=UPI000DE70C59|nr:hypothetical protein [Raoultella sp. BIGb0138]SSG62067.1 Uncharacterised protein [Klebsiella pneumoniae]HBM7350575.1 hypothetical protein [Klebsiella oxytoca]TCW07106.1 hypothetical protein EDF73_113168 [Raoultella sp. BIGb0138]HBX6306992.1 hypothetical protein [Klebsiella pneumoniae]HBZ0731970.1 hypothetical protein [Klebsiella pneumoniae]
MKLQKPLSRILLTLSACVMLAACQSEQQQLTTQSDALTTKPVVNCEESKSFQKLPDYPECTDCDKTTDTAVLRAYIATQQEWAVKTIGVYTYNSILRDNTADCLNQLRASGIIN